MSSTTTTDPYDEAAEAPTVDADRIARLEATVAALEARLASTDAPAPSRTDWAETPEAGATSETQLEHGEPNEPNEPSRRRLFRLAAGAAAAGSALAVAGGARPVAAADTDPITVGGFTSQGDTGRTATIVRYQNSLAPQVTVGLADAPANAFLVRDNLPGPFNIAGAGNESAYPAAVAGHAFSALRHGVQGYSTVADGYGVVGRGGANTTGMLARGGRANIELENEGTDPATRSDSHRRGEIICSAAGTLWYCVDGGTPGTWTMLASNRTVSSFQPLPPTRVYDSRFTTNLASGTTRTVSVQNKINVSDGSFVEGVLPGGTEVVVANITITRTSGAGFVTINPGGDTVAAGSTINWSSSGSTIANAGTFLLGAALDVEIVVGGTGSTDVIIDLSGFYRGATSAS